MGTVPPTGPLTLRASGRRPGPLLPAPPQGSPARPRSTCRPAEHGGREDVCSQRQGSEALTLENHLPHASNTPRHPSLRLQLISLSTRPPGVPAGPQVRDLPPCSDGARLHCAAEHRDVPRGATLWTHRPPAVRQQTRAFPTYLAHCANVTSRTRVHRRGADGRGGGMGCGDAEGLDQGTSSRVSPGVDCPAGRPRFTGLRSTRHLP